MLRQHAKAPIIELPLFLFELLTEQAVIHRIPDGDCYKMKPPETSEILLQFH